MSLRSLSVLAVLAGALLAGCSGTDAPATGAFSCDLTPWDVPGVRLQDSTVDPIDDNRENASIQSTYNVRTCSLPPIGRNVLSSTDVPHKYLGELDMRGDLNLGAVAVVGSGEEPGVYLLEITDRANPAVISYIAQPGAHVTDVKFSDDGAVLYVASQALPGAASVGMLQGAPDIVAPAGVTVYSLADPAAPTYLGFVADAQVGCHMLEPVHVAPGQDALYCISQAVRVYLIQRDLPVLVNLGFVDYMPAEPAPVPSNIPAVGDPSCRLPSTVPDPAPDPELCLLTSGPHDVTVFHEGGSFGAGPSYAIVSHWDEGVRVLDMTEAPVVTEVGSWTGEGATHYDGNVHTAMMFYVGEERYILASPEYTAPGTVPSLWLLDATDLSALHLVAEWFHPGEHDSQGLFLTTHQWQVAPVGPNVTADEVRVYLSYNHAGVWVLDLGQILAGDAQAAILGYNLARPELAEDAVPNAILSTWDVNVVDGHIYGTDRATGLWVFHYQGDELGDQRLRGFG